MRQARQRQSQVCGVHGRGLSGFGQQVHLWPLSIPDPAARLISPGRRVFRRVTSCHRPWPGCRAPTNPPSSRARPSRSRIAYPRYAPRWGLAGTVWVRPAARRRDGWRVLDHHFPYSDIWSAPGHALRVPVDPGVDARYPAAPAKTGHRRTPYRRCRSSPSIDAAQQLVGVHLHHPRVLQEISADPAPCAEIQSADLVPAQDRVAPPNL
jgi:hypothetical protein